MASQPPVLLVDNVFDTVQLYPGAVLTASSEVAGREARRVADYRRDRTWWEPTSDGAGAANWIRVDLGAGESRAPDFLWLDRGHTLAGRTVRVQGSDDGVTWPAAGSERAFTIPAATVVGGDPTSTTPAQTEEGAAYAFFGPLTARRYWRFAVDYVAAFVPRVTGLMLGVRHQLAVYSSTLDEDAGARKMPTAESDAGYVATGPVYDWRTLELDLKMIGAAEYDATIRDLRRLLFQRKQPVAVAMNYGDHPERAWLYQLDGTTWGAPTATVYRSTRLRLREVGPLLTR